MIGLLRFYRHHILLSGLVFLLACLLSVYLYGINLGLEFQGGIEIELSSQAVSSVAEMRDLVALPQAQIIPYGSPHDFLIKIPASAVTTDTDLLKMLSDKWQAQKFPFEIHRFDKIGAEFSATIMNQSLIALSLAMLGILCYVAARFEWRLAVGALLALFFDPIVILGAFALFQWVFDPPALAGLLSVIGYSINDTIVVFDRFRENMEYSSSSSEDVFYLSLEQIFKRTIITSMLTFLVVVALLIFGTEVLRGFALAFAIGIIVGTLSSVLIAGPIALMLGVRKEGLFPPPPDLRDRWVERHQQHQSLEE
jgi:preprotein translocase subunit SecF